MKGKWLEHLKHIKKEQWIVLSSSGRAASGDFSAGGEKRAGGEDRGGRLGNRYRRRAMSRTEARRKNWRKNWREPCPGWKGWERWRWCCHWNPPIRKWWRRMCPLPEQSGKLRRSGEQQRFIGHHRGEHGVQTDSDGSERLMWSGKTTGDPGCSGSSPGRRGPCGSSADPGGCHGVIPGGSPQN